MFSYKEPIRASISGDSNLSNSLNKTQTIIIGKDALKKNNTTAKSELNIF
jgi:hypothetical protein